MQTKSLLVKSPLKPMPATFQMAMDQGMTEKTVSFNDNSSEELLTKRAQLYEIFSIPGTITQRNTRLTHLDGVYTLTVDYVSEQDIALRTPIGIENAE